MLDISLELKGKAGEIVTGENSLAACLRRLVLQCGDSNQGLYVTALLPDIRNLKSSARRSTAVVNAANRRM
jgi:hypothetical protein